MDRRLQQRFVNLVKSHMHGVSELAAGVASLPDVNTAFAATQGAWRFLNNDRVKLSALCEPLRDVGRRRVAESRGAFALLVHDWCKLSYDHPSKDDLVQLTHADDVGYELTTALLVNADDGSPLAPMEMHLKTGAGTLSTRDPKPKTRPHLEQVLPTMRASRTWNLSKPLIHVIDREADSVDHYRRWDADGHLFLVRADDRRVRHAGVSCLLSEVRRKLRQKKALQQVGQAAYRGCPAQLWVGETEVVLYRPAKKNVRGKKYEKAGRQLRLRLLVVEVRDDDGQVLAHWLLLTNAPPELASTEHLAWCYYWRWRIESFFKLLKSHGQQLEHWQQKTGPAIARRLLIAAMACVVVWQLQADTSPKATRLKTILVRLSGRQTKRAHPHTAPALLAGTWILLSMLALLEQYDLDQIKRLANDLIPLCKTG
jgi:hypothetical protein